MATLSTASPQTRLDWRAYLRDLWRLRDFTAHLARGNIEAKHAATGLGLLWWLVNPLLMTAIYFVAFGLILGGRRGNPEYLAWLISGVFPFKFMADTLNGSTGQILGNAKLIVNSRFPRLVLPIAATIEALFGLLVGLGAFYLIVMPLNGVFPTAWLALLPVGVVVHLAFSFGLGSLIARYAVPYRDVRNVIPHAIRMWFYLSPVLWDLTMLANLEDTAPWIIPIVKANPMFSILSVYRTALLGEPFDAVQLVIAIAWAVAALLIGVAMFMRNDRHMARYL